MKEFFNFLRRWKYDFLIAMLYFITVGFMIKYCTLQTLDIKVHNFLLRDYLQEGFFPWPPGYYSILYIVDFIIRIKHPFVVSSFIVLTFFLWWKYKLVNIWISNSGGLKQGYVAFLSISFLFLSPIYIPAIDGPFWYLGKFTQTIWHNSTLIASFPFSILLVKQTFTWFESKKEKDLLYMLALGLGIILIKPSFMFCFIPALPIFTLFRERKLSKTVFISLGLSFSFFLLLLLEKELIYTWDPMIPKLYSSEEQSQVILNPFRLFLHYSTEPVFDFFSSFPLTLVFLFLWRKKAFDSQFFNFSLLLLIFALAVYFLFAETGFRELHGNFYWQIPIALFLHNLSIVLIVVQEFLANNKKVNIKIILISAVYLVQVLLGINYWLRLFYGYTLS
ncbi:MAG: hypothetical protein PSV36_10325 [Algoriphagus sp.]|nr:hypothetical protein [Algoriphagus sp.]